MKKTIAAAILLGCGFAPIAQAQVIVDMSLLTCKQMLDAPIERAPFITAWMAGYFGATQDRATVDLRYLERNIKVATDYCKGHPSDNLMAVIEKTAK
ncbi:HdeA/HdeB family chaperone [Methylocella silvestris]|uniref:HdeA/HdeB family protein n=1 Tax=Methylocella silvestris TaxID=199596 RepID=A0A2J7TD96_METSI|nr:HdeA/HdeB family chaperone [Methylocella silvestris]PNG24730.1 hypothetical protein CR492_17160 [Methylocella silvestris]